MLEAARLLKLGQPARLMFGEYARRVYTGTEHYLALPSDGISVSRMKCE